MTALTPAQRARNYRLRKRTEKTVIACARRCEGSAELSAWCEKYAFPAAAAVNRHAAELASIQAFAAVAHMQRQLHKS